ncbi:MAG: protein-L-isoaspartate(D-aspartate) O-methyltransferase [Deltaproteobacteria bacterium]|nr:protein-L-isoaspartate(D-aspartate) O-methyltransferase [Deltaproteobacteria bacterium]
MNAKIIDSLTSKGITSSAVLEALEKIPRERFVEQPFRNVEMCYGESPLPIGHNQTISSVYTVALMTQALELNKNHKVLEIGTGSGYQAAVLSLLCDSVFTIERIRDLSLKARTAAEFLNIRNTTFIIGDGSIGFREYAPYDRILITACSPDIPQPLFNQLCEGGIMVAPVERNGSQNICVIEKKDGRVFSKEIAPANFVKLIGKNGYEAQTPQRCGF